MATKYETDAVTWQAQIRRARPADAGPCDRTLAMVQAIKDHLEGKLLLEGRAMTDERDKHIKALMQRLTAQHREADRRETHRAAGGRAGEGPGSKLTWSPPFTV